MVDKWVYLGVGIVLVLVFALVLPASPVNVNKFPQLSSTGVSFQACTDYLEGSADCTNSINIPIQSVTAKHPTDVKLQGASGSFTYQGTPKTWKFECVGTISFGNGQNAPIVAGAAGAGSPPSNWPISLSPRQWNLSSIYGANYGQKNLTAQLGSKASPCSLTVTFNEIESTPVKISYRYASLAKWSVNYQASSVTTSTSTTTSQTTSTTTSQTSTITTSSTTTGGNTVTTSQTDIWATTVNSATNGQTGSLAVSGIIVDCQPYAVQSGYTLCFAYVPAGYPLPSCNSGSCGQVTVVTKSTSVGAFGLALSAGQWTQANIPIGTSAVDLVIAQVFQSGQMIYNQAITISQPTTDPSTGVAQVPISPYTQTYLNQISTSTVSSYSPSSSTCPYISPSKCAQMSIISVTF